GRSLKGTCAVKKQVPVCGHRLSGLGLLTIDGMVAVSVVEGSFTAATFKTFIKGDIVSVCLSFPVEHLSCSTSCHYVPHAQVN
ncbi:hypothetical protein EDB19DRAFT_1642171, partial [Suillus lakei]